jgi:hypothetical protein
MSRIATARKVAQSIVATVDALTKAGNAALIDNMWSPAIALANSIAEGYVTGISAEGAQYLMSINYQLIALNAPADEQPPAEPVECDSPSGTRYRLISKVDSYPVLVGETARDNFGDGERFVIAGAVWRDDINETQPCMVGNWESNIADGDREVYALNTDGFMVRWERIA